MNVKTVNGKPASQGPLLVVASSLMYATYGIWVTLVGDFLSPYTASALRNALVLLMIVTFAGRRGGFKVISIRAHRRYFAGLIITAFAIQGPMYYAINHAGIGLGLAVSYTCIVLGMFVFGCLFMKEPFTRPAVIAASLGIAGLAAIFWPTTAGISILGLAAAALSGSSNAAHMVIAKKLPYPPVPSLVCIWSASLVANTLVAIAFERSFPPLTADIRWLYLLIFAAASFLAWQMFMRGLKILHSGSAGVLGLSEIVFSIFFGVVFFHERPGLVAWIGMGLIVGAAGVSYIFPSKTPSKTPGEITVREPVDT